QARTEFERVLAMQPDDAPTRLNLARIEAAAGNQEAVRTLVRPVVVATPDNEAALLMLAEAEARLGNTTEAIRLLDQGLSLVPNSLQIRAALGGMHLALGDPARVLDLLRGLTPAQFDGLPRLLELRGRAELA
ncbi:tetratricopeptide repeat protein, partial [Arthrospira platensis SPKY1]|nr:tetratricopeptide repeat protein [Arthrospira platensis SPKY1]